jgi:hypothetical protein
VEADEAAAAAERAKEQQQAEKSHGGLQVRSV